MGVKIKDNTIQFANAAEKQMDYALARMANDIELIAKVKKVPVSKGHLQSSIRSLRLGKLKFRVEVNKEYARFQEMGGDGKRKVRNYSKPGTGAHFLRDSGKIVSDKSKLYLKNAIKLIRIRKPK